MLMVSRFFGWFFVAIGIVLFFGGISVGITGFTIFEDSKPLNISFLGILSLIVGVLLLKSSATLEDFETKMHHFKGRKELRTHNREAHEVARLDFRKTYGRSPTKEELQRYTRHLHERHYLHDVIEDYRPHKKRYA